MNCGVRTFFSLLVSIVAVVAACDDSESPESDTSTGVGGSEGEIDAQSEKDEIQIPMRPRAQGTLSMYGTLDSSSSPPNIQVEADVTLAVGDRYPAMYLTSLPGNIWLDCGPVEATIKMSSVSPGAKRTDAQIVADDQLALEVHEPGIAVLTVLGTATMSSEACGVSAGTELQLRLDVAVKAQTVASARIDHPCEGQSPQIAPGAGASDSIILAQWFRPVLLNESGEPFYADNAAPDAQADVKLSGSFDPSERPPATLGQWRPSMSGLVEIVALGGAATVVEVIEPTQLVRGDVVFQLAGTASSPIEIVEGASYGPKWGRAANRLAPMMEAAWTKNGRLCSGVPAAWFELQSLTPEVCNIVPLKAEDANVDLFYLFGDRVGQAARLHREGVCALQLDAPRAMGGSGAKWTISAHFADPEGLHE